MSMSPNARPDPQFKIGDGFTKEVTFDRDGVVAFATLAGDLNPLHHDEQLAKASPFKGLIASGTQTSSVMLGALATYVCARASAVGLEFSVKLKKAVRADERTTISWEVTRVEWAPTLNGHVVIFEGKMHNSEGVVAIRATGVNLIFGPREAPAG